MVNTSQSVETTDNRYLVRTHLPREFEDMEQMLKYQLDDPSPKIKDKTIFSDIIGSIPDRLLGSKARDSSLGGNDAINCFYQFNENDDIIPRANRINGQEKVGMGRVYSETYDDQQQILHMSFGVADFSSIKKFYEAMIDQDLSQLMNSGKYSVVKTVATTASRVVVTVIALPFVAAKWGCDFLSSPGMNSPSKYYDFKPTMAIYYKLVNVILAHLAVNMNLNISDVMAKEGIKSDGTPDLFKKHGSDILTILSKKLRYEDNAKQVISTEEFWKQAQAADEKSSAEDLAGKEGGDGKIERFKEGWKIGQDEGLLFVGFRLDKGTDSSESASNTTKESSLSQTINSTVQANKAKLFNVAGLRNAGAAGAALGAAADAITGVIGGSMEAFGMKGGLELLKGSGLIDIPEVWENSTFSKTYNFNFQLRTPMADKLSIFYSLYTPLAMLLAGAFPRSVGPNAYTTPFIVRCYCKGMFAIPMGIIDNITITRGAAEYGWSRDRLPTQIDISFGIKDLSPVMHMPLADGSITKWANIFGQNNSFQEYLSTLGGLGLQDRVLTSRLLKRRVSTLAKITMENKLNPMMMGFSLSNSHMGRALSAFYPHSRLPSL